MGRRTPQQCAIALDSKGMVMRSSRKQTRRLIGLAVALALCSANALAEPVQFSIPAGDAAETLKAFGAKAGVQLLFVTGAADKRPTPALNAKLEPAEALQRLLQGTGLTFEFVNERTVAVRRVDSASSAEHALRDGRIEAIRLVQASGGSMASGQTGAASEDTASTQVDEIVVTAKRKFRPETSNAASKFELPIIETPQALTVLSSEFLDIARLNDTAGVVAYTPGVELQGIGDGTQAGLFARGFQVNRERGFRINGLSTDSEIDLDYFAMDRVEFVRGPASSLYGEADYGATINRVLKAPDGRFGASTSLEVGSYDLKRLQGDLRGALFGSDVASGRVIAAVQDSKGFIRDTEDDRVLIAPSLKLDLGSTRILFQGYHEKMTGSTSDGFPLLFVDNEYVLPKLPRRNNYAADINKIDSTNQFLYSSVDHKLSDTLNLSFKAGFSRINMENVSSFLFFATPEGDSSLYYGPEYKTKKDLSFDLSLEKHLELAGREHKLLLSADWRRNTAFQDVYGFFPLGTLNIFEGGPLTDYSAVPEPLPAREDGQFWSSKQYFSGVTALAHLRPTDRLALLLGMRYSAIESSIRDFVPLYGIDTDINSQKDHAWVPRAAAVYKLAEGHNLYLSYSEGIIFNQRFLRADGQPVHPEQGVQYEAGVKGELFDRRLMYSASLFQITRTDVAAPIDALPGQPVYYRNIGKQVHRGGEIEVMGEPIPGLNIVANYSNLDVEIRESRNPAEVGHRPLASPPHSYSLFTTYEILNGPMRSLTFGGGLVGRSKREVDTVGTFQLPAYTRVDFRASYDLSEAASVELNVQNAFNERIYVSSYWSPALGIGYAYPRAVFGRLSYHW